MEQLKVHQDDTTYIAVVSFTQNLCRGKGFLKAK